MGPDRPTAGVGPDRPTAGVGADETPARVGPGEPDTGPGPDKPAAERGPDKLPAGVGPGQSVIGVGPGEPVGGVGPGRSVVGVGPGEPTGGVGSGQSVVGAGLGGWGVGLGWVEGVWAARTPSQVLRGVSRRQGRLLLRLAGRVWPEVLEYLPDDGEVPRPIVLGVVAAVNGLSAEQLARTVAYEDAQTVVSASLKLLPVDPADAAAWLAGLHDDIERLVKDVAPLTDPDTIPADGAPLIDVFAHQHSTERMRLFNA
ncbi:urease accessory protein UreF [Kribbella aluminosa]|uniref:urease accessory protein UreF n=1 Tax=Kribbella aluminosa TaxID=416017 RepID=UPI001AE7B742|nr:urease accessory UreF family protein [Kribbella aluminosa]